jgi:hypothetical protein
VLALIVFELFLSFCISTEPYHLLNQSCIPFCSADCPASTGWTCSVSHSHWIWMRHLPCPCSTLAGSKFGLKIVIMFLPSHALESFSCSLDSTHHLCKCWAAPRVTVVASSFSAHYWWQQLGFVRRPSDSGGSREGDSCGYLMLLHYC